MYEYEIMDEFGNRDIIFGYNFNDACARSNIDPMSVECLSSDYID